MIPSLSQRGESHRETHVPRQRCENIFQRLCSKTPMKQPVPDQFQKFHQKGVVSLKVLGLTVLVLTNNAVKSRWVHQPDRIEAEIIFNHIFRRLKGWFLTERLVFWVIKLWYEVKLVLKSSERKWQFAEFIENWNARWVKSPAAEQSVATKNSSRSKPSW